LGFRIAGSRVRQPWARVASSHLLAIGLVALATAIRRAFGEGFGGVMPFFFYEPAVLAAALVGGWPAGLTALTASTVVAWYFFLEPRGFVLTSPTTTVNLLLFLASAALLVVVGARLKSVLQSLRSSHTQLAEREFRYRTLFQSISDGFALVEAIWDSDGRLVDYLVLEANPALHRILGVESSLVGRRQGEALRNGPPAWLQACEAALRGPPLSFEYHTPGGRWFEIHLSKVADNRLAQIVLEITDRKVAERRHSEMFDELNHRVKNNLAVVSAMLNMQGRATDQPQVRDHLAKAVDRIQTIADVHASLYRSSRKDDVDFAAYLRDLCERLSDSLLDSDRVRLDLACEPAALPLDMAVSMGVVVNELVTNAAKYAYPAPAGGVISVKLSRSTEAVTLSVGDSGVGLPAQPQGSGLGMRLVRSLVQQMGATLEVEHHPGATFKIRLPAVGLFPASAHGQARLL
jgi:two-component sensor histidine kinase/PAS domain-containing protein